MTAGYACVSKMMLLSRLRLTHIKFKCTLARKQIFPRFVSDRATSTPLFSYVTSKDVTSEGAYSIWKLYQDYPIVSKQPSTKPDELRAHVNYANEKTIKPLSYYGSALAKAPDAVPHSGHNPI